MGLGPGQPCKADNPRYSNVSDYGVFIFVKKAFFCIQKCLLKRAIEVPAWPHRWLGARPRLLRCKILGALICPQLGFRHTMNPTYKLPQSVLVVIHTREMHVLLLRRADMGSWQSVTGSKDALDEPLASPSAESSQGEPMSPVTPGVVQAHTARPSPPRSGSPCDSTLRSASRVGPSPTPAAAPLASTPFGAPPSAGWWRRGWCAPRQCGWP